MMVYGDLAVVHYQNMCVDMYWEYITKSSTQSEKSCLNIIDEVSLRAQLSLTTSNQQVPQCTQLKYTNNCFTQEIHLYSCALTTIEVYYTL